ncbi:MAG: hypothetical protein WDW38_004826 [Sanguina aurantia]
MDASSRSTPVSPQPTPADSNGQNDLSPDSQPGHPAASASQPPSQHPPSHHLNDLKSRHPPSFHHHRTSNTHPAASFPPAQASRSLHTQQARPRHDSHTSCDSSNATHLEQAVTLDDAQCSRRQADASLGTIPGCPFAAQVAQLQLQLAQQQEFALRLNSAAQRALQTSNARADKAAAAALAMQERAEAAEAERDALLHSVSDTRDRIQSSVLHGRVQREEDLRLCMQRVSETQQILSGAGGSEQDADSAGHQAGGAVRRSTTHSHTGTAPQLQPASASVKAQHSSAPTTPSFRRHQAVQPPTDAPSRTTPPLHRHRGSAPNTPCARTRHHHAASGVHPREPLKALLLAHNSSSSGAAAGAGVGCDDADGAGPSAAVALSVPVLDTGSSSSLCTPLAPPALGGAHAHPGQRPGACAPNTCTLKMLAVAYVEAAQAVFSGRTAQAIHDSTGHLPCQVRNAVHETLSSSSQMAAQSTPAQSHPAHSSAADGRVCASPSQARTSATALHPSDSATRCAVKVSKQTDSDQQQQQRQQQQQQGVVDQQGRAVLHGLLPLMAGIAASLAAVHEQGDVYGHVTSDNMMIVSEIQEGFDGDRAAASLAAVPNGPSLTHTTAAYGESTQDRKLQRHTATGTQQQQQQQQQQQETGPSFEREVYCLCQAFVTVIDRLSVTEMFAAQHPVLYLTLWWGSVPLEGKSSHKRPSARQVCSALRRLK